MRESDQGPSARALQSKDASSLKEAQAWPN
jgi:hypothetical protein